MEPLYLGPYYWPIESPLRLLQAHGGTVGILLPPGEFTPANQTLLEKILAAVHWRLEDTTLFEAQISLKWGRLSLCLTAACGSLARALLAVPVGVYEVPTGHRLNQLPNSPSQIVWRLPTLSDMQNNPAAKQRSLAMAETSYFKVIARTGRPGQGSYAYPMGRCLRRSSCP